jgi:16S rRNA processing protein RimM
VRSSKSRIDLIAIGKIVGVFGIRGEMKIAPMTYSVDRFTEGLTVRIGRDETAEQCRSIKKIRMHGPGLVIHCEGIETRSEAERCVGHFLFVDRDHRITLPPQTWFISDIIGMTVTDENGATIGSITDVLQLPGHHVYVIRQGKREILIPAVPSVIQSVDVERRLMVIHVLDGLLEI